MSTLELEAMLRRAHTMRVWLIAPLLTLGCCVWPGNSNAQAAPSPELESLAERCDSLNYISIERVGDAPGRIVQTKMVVGKPAPPADQVWFKKRGHSQGIPTPMLEKFPDHCRVEGYVTPHVRFNLLLPPPDKWNGRFMLAACDAWCGKLHEEIVIPGLHRGFATLTNDGGHYSRAPFDGIWAHKNMPARIDFAHRANHVTAQAGKAIVAAYYGSPVKYSYITGFSKGGNAGLWSALRYPTDFDGVFAKAPVPYYQWKNAAHFPWLARVVYPDGRTPVMFAEKADLIGRAVMSACDAIDGLADNVIDDPRKCRFDPQVLACKPSQPEAECLTPPQLDAVRKLYAKPTGKNGKPYYDYPLDYGSESNWSRSILPERNSREPTFSMNGAVTGLRYMVFKDNPGPDYDWMQFDYVRERPNLEYMSKILDPSGTDLRAFKARGGKLIIVHGWSDAMVSASMSIDWFESLEKAMGGRKAAAEFAQLYAVAGMHHGSGGEGPYEFDALSGLMKWVEEGVAPDRLLLVDEVDVKLGRRRPAFPYPAIAKYDGKGDPKIETSFVRVEP
jgi:hypothetical protein